MTILTTEDASTIGQVWAAREAETGDLNFLRTDNWKRRLFRDPVAVPEASRPPKCPAYRSSVSGNSNVTNIRDGSRG